MNEDEVKITVDALAQAKIGDWIWVRSGDYGRVRWHQKQVTKVTRLSAICGEGWNETKFNIKTGVERETRQPAKAFGRLERENEEFIQTHRNNISNYVSACKSASDLVRIANIVGYSLNSVKT